MLESAIRKIVKQGKDAMVKVVVSAEVLGEGSGRVVDVRVKKQ